MATGRIGTTPVLQVRWSKAPAGGTTSLSGLDDNSVSLVYSVGYEAVYRNGVLLSRTNDYTATDGTTITLIDATIAGDIIEVFANQTIPLSDTYSQSVANGKFINNTLTTTTGDIIYASAANTPARLGIGSTDQVLKVSGGIPAWAAPAGPTWTSYTPTYTNVTIGNGTVVAEYAVSGKIVWIRYLLTWGSTTSFSGTVGISFPTGYDADTGLSTPAIDSGNNGFVTMRDANVNTFYSGQVYVTSSTRWRFNPMNASGTYITVDTSVNASVPFTWTTSDQLQAIFYYRSV